MFSYLVDLAVQLRRDADLTEAELHRRDRLLLRERQPVPQDRRDLLVAWVDALRAAGHQLPGIGLSAAYRLLVLGLAILGILVGGGVASVVFQYDGSRPVNVVHVLAVFVVAQLAVLVLLGVVALPARLLRRIPGALAVQEALAWLSPGQAIRLLLRRLPSGVRDFATRTARPFSMHREPLGAVWKWAAILAAQVFAVAFNLGALTTCLYLVSFSDLAFAWSTTLEPSVERVHRVTELISRPWARVLPEAVPSLDLIRDTQFYRREATRDPSDPQRWGGWWPFLVAGMVTYGALPRALLLAWAGWRFKRNVERAFVESPGAELVLDRIGSQWVSTQATVGEAGEPSQRDAQPSSDEDRIAATLSFCLLNWGGLELSDAVLRERFTRSWQRSVLSVHHAGGRASIAGDTQTIATLARAADDSAIAVLVKGWEPPLLEFVDFVHDLRKACGSRRLILVTPVGLVSDGEVRASTEAEFSSWQRKVRSLGDPALVVRAWPEAKGANA